VISFEQAQQIIANPVIYNASHVVTLRQAYGDLFVDSAIELMHTLGGVPYFNDAIRQLAREQLRQVETHQLTFVTLAKNNHQRSARLFKNPANKRIPATILAHRSKQR